MNQGIGNTRLTQSTRSTCPYCGVGCGVIIESSGTQITGVRGDPNHPANFGRLCSKGATLHLTAQEHVIRQTRLLQPMQRLQPGQPPQPVAWDAALDFAAKGFAHIIRQHGSDAVGFYVSGQLLTEDYYVFNQLAKGLIGTNNIDSNSRLCMSSAVAGYKQTLGADAPPACYEDIDHAACIFIAGANPAVAHPILARRIEAAKKANPQLKLVIVDPRATDTAAMSDLHLGIQPGTDVMLFNGMLHIMAWEGWLDQAFIDQHTQGFAALKATVRDCTPAAVAATCGITQEALLQATRWFVGLDGANGVLGTPRSPTLSLYCQGLNQSSSGTAKNAALINLHLATGQIGQAGAGPFSLTGQPNAMGGREVGGMANLLSAHRDMANPAHRAEVAALWGVPSVPNKPGKTAVEMFQAAADGEIKALWIACTNPAHSLPNQATVQRALERAELVVLQESFATTLTARYADLLLPASTWGEKEGTVTNSERRISRVRAAAPAPGAARHDWQIVVDFAKRLEGLLGTKGASTQFPYTSPESIWNQHRASTRGRDLDITGLSYAQLEAAPQQWPFPEGAQHGTPRLYADGIFPTPDGKARFANTRYQPVAEACNARYPFALNTGRLRDQWHGMSRSGTVAGLWSHAPEPAMDMHPLDMVRLGLAAGDIAQVRSARGQLCIAVRSSTDVARNQAYVPMHWEAVNALTNPAFCATSKQPELKHSAVHIARAELPWKLLAMAWLPADTALARRAQLQEQLGAFAYAHVVPFSDGAPSGHAAPRTGLLLRAAHPNAVDAALLQTLEQLLHLDSPSALRYADPSQGQRRSFGLQTLGENTVLQAFLLAGDTRAEGWMAVLLKESHPVQAYGRALLMPTSTPPMPVASRGTTVCSCVGVTDVAIQNHLQSCAGSAVARLESLQKTLHCGTQCGSCVPQLRRIEARCPHAPQPPRPAGQGGA